MSNRPGVPFRSSLVNPYKLLLRVQDEQVARLVGSDAAVTQHCSDRP